ncbi:MAG: RraA family protein [Symbiobacteriaceae bacterium]|nr:RraA family protein [Symbiobacteriaceae bacterium]
MNPKVGLRIITEFQRPDPLLVKRYGGIPASNISDVMYRFYCMHEYIRSMNNRPMAGVAFTVKVPSSDNTFIHYALDLAEPGDILVVDGGSEINRALMGEIMFTYAQQRGIAGVIVDGAIRDIDCLQTLTIPIYAKGITPQGPYKNGPGEINVPVACGGQVVTPGDIIVGDSDGVVVIPQGDAAYIIDLAEAKLASEEERLASYRRGDLDREQHLNEYLEFLKGLGTTWVK